MGLSTCLRWQDILESEAYITPVFPDPFGPHNSAIFPRGKPPDVSVLGPARSVSKDVRPLERVIGPLLPRLCKASDAETVGRRSEVNEHQTYNPGVKTRTQNLAYGTKIVTLLGSKSPKTNYRWRKKPFCP
nr:hypothetical protein CFP56_11083 [Quercus suber]